MIYKAEIEIANYFFVERNLNFETDVLMTSYEKTI